ncbi:MAG: nucleotidyltransferase family protein [Bacteroidota bacterium]|nr:nucleotidyltransferase family protein [Bacteroidota bacterium]
MKGIIILAAGSSSRLGKPKQLLTYLGKTLLRHVTDEALGAGIGPVLVVLGSDSARIKTTLPEATLAIVNEQWEEGMASSIRIGLWGMLKAYPLLEGVILAVCDQPFVSGSLFRRLSYCHAMTGKPIIASAYARALGTPVLFDKKYFPHLLRLQGQQGAKRLIALYPEDVTSVPFELGEIDIDRPEDYLFLQ